MGANNNRKNFQAISNQLIGTHCAHELKRELMRQLFLLPSFLHKILYYYYFLDYTESATAHTLNTHEHLIRQQITVATTLLNILYASKPKNPV